MGAVKSIAMTFSDKEYLLYYLERKDYPNLEKILTKRPELINVKLTENTKMTPLYRAAYNGNVQMVTFLVEKFNADVNFATEIGETPLVAAVKRDHIRVIRYLLEHGADPNFISSIGLSVLQYAILPGYYQTALLIVQKCKKHELRSIQEYDQMGSNYHYRYVNYKMMLDCLQKRIEPENVPDYLKKIKKHYKDPVIDPRETWKEWIKRQAQFKDPPLVERDELPEDLQPQNRKLGKLHYFMSKFALSPLSQKPNFYPKSKSMMGDSDNEIDNMKNAHSGHTDQQIQIRTVS